MARLSRARFISGLAGAAALPYVEWLRPALAQAVPAKLSDIEHFVILMQENRSFDHYFGTLSGVRGYSDPTAGLLLNGKTVFHQPDGENHDGFVLPFRLDTKTTNAQRLHDLSHSWNALHASWNRGRLDGFVSAHRATNRRKRPAHDGLLYARRFAVLLRVGRRVYDLRRLLLFGDGPDLSEPLLLDDRIE